MKEKQKLNKKREMRYYTQNEWKEKIKEYCIVYVRLAEPSNIWHQTHTNTHKLTWLHKYTHKHTHTNKQNTQQKQKKCTHIY